MSKFKFVRFGVAGALLLSAVALVAGEAFAAPGTTNDCVIYDVAVDTNATRLTLHCTNDPNHYTAGYAGCPAASADQIKAWHSQAMAALLSGKKVAIVWDNACGSRAMSGFVLTRN